MKKIILTGATGKTGRIVLEGLKGYEVTSIALPDIDLRNYNGLVDIFKGHDMIIHFAWNTTTENWKSPTIDPDNIKMVANVYRAAVEAKVPRVLMASSVHADDFPNWEGPGLLSPHRVPIPQNPYGASKVFMEALGRHYAAHHNLEVICVRFAGMNPENIPPPKEQDLDRRRWLTHNDLFRLLKCCIDAKKIKDNYCIFYGVCNHPRRIHDYSNPLGWEPKENADDLQFNKFKECQ
ncbi:MAG: NAD(P)-dependent oxidoreductase [Nanoarchaeota archaeon]